MKPTRKLRALLPKLAGAWCPECVAGHHATIDSAFDYLECFGKKIIVCPACKPRLERLNLPTMRHDRLGNLCEGKP